MEKSAVFVPLVASDQTRGMIELGDTEREDAFSASDVRLLQTLANAMSVALENARLFNETQRRTRESAALAEVGRDISSTLDLPTVMDRIARHAKDLLAVDNSAIFLPDRGGRTYRAIVSVGDISQALQATEIELGEGHHRQPVAERPCRVHQRHRCGPARAPDHRHRPSTKNERLMVAPLMAGQGRQRRDGRVADRRQAVRPDRARFPRRAFAAGHRRHRERAALRRVATARRRACDRQQGVAAARRQARHRGAARARRRADSRRVQGGRRLRGASRPEHRHDRVPVPVRRTRYKPLQDRRRPDRHGSSAPAQPRSSSTPTTIAASSDSARGVVGRRALSYLGVPIIEGGTCMGVVSVQSTKIEGAYDADDERLLSTIAANVGVALQNARLFNETKEALEQQTATRRGAARHQRLGRRHDAGLRQDSRERPASVRDRAARHLPRRRRQPAPRGRVARRRRSKQLRARIPKPLERYDDGRRDARAPHESTSPMPRR